MTLIPNIRAAKTPQHVRAAQWWTTAKRDDRDGVNTTAGRDSALGWMTHLKGLFATIPGEGRYHGDSTLSRRAGLDRP